MVLWELFSTFFIIGFVSFGGGYAMIPVIETEVSSTRVDDDATIYGCHRHCRDVTWSNRHK